MKTEITIINALAEVDFMCMVISIGLVLVCFVLNYPGSWQSSKSPLFQFFASTDYLCFLAFNIAKNDQSFRCGDSSSALITKVTLRSFRPFSFNAVSISCAANSNWGTFLSYLTWALTEPGRRMLHIKNRPKKELFIFFMVLF